MVVLGTGAAALTRHQGAPTAIWLTLGYFAVMEALQVAGYAVIDQCGTPANRSVTVLSYLHIAFQPIFINAFAMALVPDPVRLRARMWVFAITGLASMVMLAQLLPADAFGRCTPGVPLCAERLCTVSGNWHIAWDIPYNGLMVPIDTALGFHSGFPTYMIAVFLLPLVYGAWRFVLLHAGAGPVLAWFLTDNPNEIPAIWCLFSIMIILIALFPRIRAMIGTHAWPPVANSS